jgi:hypothetical protein
LNDQVGSAIAIAGIDSADFCVLLAFLSVAGTAGAPSTNPDLCNRGFSGNAFTSFRMISPGEGLGPSENRRLAGTAPREVGAARSGFLSGLEVVLYHDMRYTVYQDIRYTSRS